MTYLSLQDMKWIANQGNREYLMRLAIKVGPIYWDLVGCMEDRITPQEVVKFIKENPQYARG